MSKAHRFKKKNLSYQQNFKADLPKLGKEIQQYERKLFELNASFEFVVRHPSFNLQFIEEKEKNIVSLLGDLELFRKKRLEECREINSITPLPRDNNVQIKKNYISNYEKYLAVINVLILKTHVLADKFYQYHAALREQPLPVLHQSPLSRQQIVECYYQASRHSYDALQFYYHNLKLVDADLPASITAYSRAREKVFAITQCFPWEFCGSPSNARSKAIAKEYESLDDDTVKLLKFLTQTALEQPLRLDEYFSICRSLAKLYSVYLRDAEAIKIYRLVSEKLGTTHPPLFPKPAEGVFLEPDILYCELYNLIEETQHFIRDCVERKDSEKTPQLQVLAAQQALDVLELMEKLVHMLLHYKMQPKERNQLNLLLISLGRNRKDLEASKQKLMQPIEQACRQLLEQQARKEAAAERREERHQDRLNQRKALILAKQFAKKKDIEANDPAAAPKTADAKEEKSALWQQWSKAVDLAVSKRAEDVCTAHEEFLALTNATKGNPHSFIHLNSTAGLSDCCRRLAAMPLEGFTTLFKDIRESLSSPEMMKRRNFELSPQVSDPAVTKAFQKSLKYLKDSLNYNEQVIALLKTFEKARMPGYEEIIVSLREDTAALGAQIEVVQKFAQLPSSWLAVKKLQVQEAGKWGPKDGPASDNSQKERMATEEFKRICGELKEMQAALAATPPKLLAATSITQQQRQL